jgi:type IV secretory pathway VirJ component
MGAASRWLAAGALALLFLSPTVSTAQSAPAPLPLIETPARGAGPADTFVVFYSGDLGWGRLNKAVAAPLAEAGLPVLGVDSLRYYWRRRTADQAAADLAAAIETYAAAWNRPRVILAGYSFGSDALPIILGRLPPTTRARIRLMVLVSPAAEASLAFRFVSWFDLPWPGSTPLAPAVAADTDIPILCIQAEYDPRAACRTFSSPELRVAALPGGHHYRGRQREVAGLILSALASTP